MSQLANPKLYGFSTVFWVLLYVGLLMVAVFNYNDHWVVGDLVYGVALLPALPLLGWIWSIWRFVSRLDEYQKMTTLMSMAIATAFLMVITVVYGFLENFAGLVQVPLYFVFPLYAFIYGLVTCFIYRKN